MSLDSVPAEDFSQVDSTTVSAIRYRLPFGSPGLLVVYADGAVAPRASSSQLRGADEGDLLWLRRSELWQLAVPNPSAVPTFALSYWIREAGEVIYGEDLRSQVPHLRRPELLLQTHIAASLFWVRGPSVLGCLSEGRDRRLRAGLARERLLLMQTALLTKRIWKVSQETITSIFREAYPHARICGLLDELASGETGMKLEQDSIHAVWLHERFIREVAACAA